MSLLGAGSLLQTIACKWCGTKSVAALAVRNNWYSYERPSPVDGRSVKMYLCSDQCVAEVKSLLDGRDVTADEIFALRVAEARRHRKEGG